MGRRWWARVRRWWATEHYVYTLRGWVPWWQVRHADLGEVGVTLGAVSLSDRVSQPARSEWYGVNSASGKDCYPAPSAEDEGWDSLGTSSNPYLSIADVGRRRKP